MKTKNLLFSALALCSITIMSCSKDDSNNPQVDTRVKTLIEDASAVGGDSDTMDVTYDASNRVSLVSQRNGNFSMAYQYNGASEYIMTMNEGGAVTLWEKFMSNGMGLLDSTVQSDMPGDSTTEKYFYNANRQLTEMRSYMYNSGTSFLEGVTQLQYDGNGNRTKEIELNNMGDTISVMTVTYNSAVPNWYTSGIQFMPAVQKNMPQTVTYYYPSTGDSETTTITYEMDGNNRITKEINTVAGTGVYTKSYIYF